MSALGHVAKAAVVAPAYTGPPASTAAAEAEPVFAVPDGDAEDAYAAVPDSTAVPGQRLRRSAAKQVKLEEEEEYTFSDMEEDSEPDAGALSDDSDDSCGFYQRQGSSRGQPRRSSARRREVPVETLVSGRAKRQRHSRAEDPDMLNTEEAITAALDESADDLPAVRSRPRMAAAPASAQPAAAAPAAAPAVQPAVQPAASLAAPAAAPPAAAGLPPAVPQQLAATTAPALPPLPLPLPAMPLSAMAFPPMPLPLRSKPAKGGRGRGRPSKAQQASMLATPALPMPFGVSALHPLASMLQAAAVQAAQMNAKLMMGPPAMQAAAALQAAALQAAMQQAKPAAAQPANKIKPVPAAAAGPAAAGHAVKADSLVGSPHVAAATAAGAGGAAAAANPAHQPQQAAAPSLPLSSAAERRTANTYGEKLAGTSARPRGSCVDVLYGCAKCRYLRAGCGTCRSREPAFTRRRLRWKPDKGRYQTGIEAPPTFRPSAEEFTDPVAYITRIKPQAEKYGVAHIVPPPGWDPPFALERGTNGLSMESFRFAVRKQFTSHLCCRAAPTPRAPATPPAHSPVPAAAAAAGGGGMRGSGGGRMGAQGRMSGEGRMGSEGRMGGDLRGGGGSGSGGGACAASNQQEQEQAAAGQQHVQQQQQQQADAADSSPAAAEVAAPLQHEAGLPAAGAAVVNGGVDAGPAPAADFGFPHIEKKHTLRSFSAYADWAKEVHFSDPLPSQASSRGSSGGGTRPVRSSQRRPRTLPNFGTQPEPSIEQIEAEFWRIVEDPEEVVESLYGQDVDSGHHGSGFPLPLWRRRLLGLHLAKQAAAQGSVAAGVELPGYQDEEERRYAEHPWNINNMPRCPSSVLRYLPGLADGELITGVMVPWLYVGSCLSAFCWHVEDHALCSVNYHHMGAPKVWYTVPARATVALEEAVRDALPHLFEANPRLMYQLVTAMSPTELKRRGVPVYRVVHEPGSFIVTMPDSYHSGFNCGFNVAEAVNFAPPSWIPYGSDIALKYRATGKPLTLSHDSLLVTLTQAAEHKAPSIKKPAAPAPDAAAPAASQLVQTAGQDAAVGVAALGDEEAAAQQAAQPAPAAAAAAADAVHPQQTAAPPAALCDSVAAAVADGGAAAHSGQQCGEEGAASLSPLGPAPLDRVPAEAVALAAGELSLRVEEERRRRMVSFVAVGALPERRMAVDTPPASTDAAGVHVNTADCDCAQCSCDLWLSAVVSTAAPGVSMCPEHAEALVRRYGCPRDSLVLLYRHSPQELDGMVEQAVGRISGAAEAVAAARLRRPRIEASRVRSVPAGALYSMVEPGHPAGALPTPQEGTECCESSGSEEDSEDDWHTEPHNGSRHHDRGSSKRRRNSGSAKHGHTGAAVAAAAAGLPAGRMDGKRARTSGVADAAPLPVPAPLPVAPGAPALSPADIAAMFARAQEQPAQAPEHAAAAMPVQQQPPAAAPDAEAGPTPASAAAEPAAQAGASAPAAAPPAALEAPAALDMPPAAAAAASGEAAAAAAAAPAVEVEPASAQHVAADAEPAAQLAAAPGLTAGTEAPVAAADHAASVHMVEPLPAEPARASAGESTAEAHAAAQPAAADEPQAAAPEATSQQQQAAHEPAVKQERQQAPEPALGRQAELDQQEAALAAPEQRQEQQQEPAGVQERAALAAQRPPTAHECHQAAAFPDLSTPHESKLLSPAGAAADSMVCEERDDHAAAAEAAKDSLFDVSDLLA